ncbi:MAG: DUF4280 domain-containing protein [Oscillospiraceae bacterium]
MALPVVSGASIACTMGAVGQLNVTSQAIVLMGGAPVATIQDSVPVANVGTCGMCMSLANPTVAAATAAALGVLTPMPCIPSPMGVWQCSGTPLAGGKPCLSTDAQLICAFGGVIRIVTPGQGAVVL